MPALYHTTHADNVAGIRADGLHGVSYRESTQLLQRARHAMNDAIDQHAQTRRDGYQQRVGSVYFWASESMSRDRCGDDDALLAVDDVANLRPLYCAPAADEERLFEVFREGYVNGQESHGSIYPAYDSRMVETTVTDFVDNAVSQWSGDAAADIEVWGVPHVPADRLRVVA